MNQGRVVSHSRNSPISTVSQSVLVCLPPLVCCVLQVGRGAASRGGHHHNNQIEWASQRGAVVDTVLGAAASLATGPVRVLTGRVLLGFRVQGPAGSCMHASLNGRLRRVHRVSC